MYIYLTLIPTLRLYNERCLSLSVSPLPSEHLCLNVSYKLMSQYFHRRSRHAPNPPSKRRRVTISGVVLNTSNLPSADGSPHPDIYTQPLVHTGSATPISPVVMGFSIQRDDPTAIEQVRAMLSVKQKQKAVVERQRGCVSSVGVTDGLRGSTAGPLEGRRGSVGYASHGFPP